MLQLANIIDCLLGAQNKLVAPDQEDSTREGQKKLAHAFLEQDTGLAAILDNWRGSLYIAFCFVVCAPRTTLRVMAEIGFPRLLHAVVIIHH